MARDVSVPLVPLHESLLVPLTVQALMLVVLHATCTVSPFRTRSGVTEKLIVGVGGGRHRPPEQPYEQVWTFVFVQLVS